MWNTLRCVCLAAVLVCANTVECVAQVRAIELPDAKYGVATEPWPERDGNHRARIQVKEQANAVWVRIPWRRRDSQPDQKEIVVVDATTGARVKDVLRVDIRREYGDVLFRPETAPGEYFVYYLPYRTKGSAYFPTTVYLSPKDEADALWKQGCQSIQQRILAGDTNGIPLANVAEIQAINEFHRFDPMEVMATAAETKQLTLAHEGKPYLLFPTDRQFSIRATDELPLRWIRSGPMTEFAGAAARGEFYTFQIGLYAAAGAVEGVTVAFSDLKSDSGQAIAAENFRCFNTGGIDWLGRSFRKNLSIPNGKVQPLWIGVQVPRDAAQATYRGSVKVQSQKAPATDVSLAITVGADKLDDAGDGELWRHSRLRWLDSAIGIDDEVVSPFATMKLDERTVEILGRRFRFNQVGLLDSIQSTFSRNVDDVNAEPKELLAAPVRFIVDGRNWASKVKVTNQAPGAITWVGEGQADGLTLRCNAKAECDGCINFKVTLHAERPTELHDVALEIPLRREHVPLMMGLGRKGGVRPTEWTWKWNENCANSQIWLGDVDAGLSLKLKHAEERWDLYNLKQSGVYRDWSYAGRGGCTLREAGDQVILRADAGPRKIASGDELHFNFALLVTPFRTLDRSHWRWRYIHQHSAPSVAEAHEQGATIINVHHAERLNPYINYPFHSTERLSRYVREGHEHKIKTKLYYTIRELSCYASEFWALRSLGTEIFVDGPGFRLADHFADRPAARSARATGNSWLCEHVIDGYVPAWHNPMGPGNYDASLATTGLSRWHNYYLEGLDWLCREIEIDGLYLDGIGYDREIMKRVRKVLDRARPGSLIDFHSGNNFHPEYGLSSPANQYLEHFPYVNSLWLGEGYNPNESPDYWLVEMSGIPFGLFSEMLGAGGNPWRGMLYGMTNRLGWSGDPRPLWKLWDDFGIRDAKMVGYWDAACPVQTNSPKVHATVYRKPGKSLVAIASWANEPQQCRLSIDWNSLGLDPNKARLLAPEIKGLQTETVAAVTDEVNVAPGGGCLLIIDEHN